MVAKISIEQLQALMLDPDTPERELRMYFSAGDDGAAPFAPRLKLNEATVEIGKAGAHLAARSETALVIANSLARLRRQVAFNLKLGDGNYAGPIIVSEGDSWFQYPILVEDVIDHLMRDYAIRSLDAAGDTMKQIERADEFGDQIESTGATIFLLSAGGNDLLAGGDLVEHLAANFPGATAADLLLPSFDALVAGVIQSYDRIFRKLQARFLSLHILCHGYDRPIPNKGRWLGTPMATRGITDPKLQADVVALMMDRFNRALSNVAGGFDRVQWVDVRGLVRGRWYDELHPTDEGFADVAARFRDHIEVIGNAPKAKTRGGRTRGRAAVGGPSRAGIPTAMPATPRRGLSLHIGLNSVSPVHYQGWDGTLAACEFDAGDMAALATGLGYGAMTLLSAAATRAAVVAGMAQAANTLEAGDIFLVSYSGHGGQVPDYSGDEDDRRDETWCLYDGQLIDDELYQMWYSFKPGVRVLVVSDSCHSGTVTRYAMEATARGPVLLPVNDPLQPRPRFMPDGIAGRVYRENRAFYDEIGRASATANEGGHGRAVSKPLRCTVRLLSGCQDNQVSLDGLANGRFTEELLRVWDNGHYAGDYAKFHKTILGGMPPTQSPEHSSIGTANLAFDVQRPFEI